MIALIVRAVHRIGEHVLLDKWLWGIHAEPGFMSDMEGLILRGAPELWIHGHVHDSHDYRVGRTRVLCNPCGYGGENPTFDPMLVIELET